MMEQAESKTYTAYIGACAIITLDYMLEVIFVHCQISFFKSLWDTPIKYIDDAVVPQY